jgi:broad specificity phosphatase PhoE
VRHGETEWNLVGRVQGHSDTPLNETGRSQIRRLASRLATTEFAAAYSSDLSRCLEGARILLEGHETPLTLAPELRELSYGVLEGRTYGEIQSDSPSLYGKIMAGDVTFAPPEGESVEDLTRRVTELMDRLLEAHQEDDKVLVVAHGGTIRAILVSLLGLPLGLFWRFRIANSSLSIVSHYQDGATLDLWNDTGHLRNTNGE